MRFFTSDHHFGHANIIQYCKRPFKNVEEMNEKLIENWNKIVSEQDTVYYLGDFSLSKAPVLNITGRLKGKKILIAGNHDRCFRKMGQTKSKHDELYLKSGWSEIHSELEIVVQNESVKLSHLPYWEEGADHMYEARYPELRPQRTTKWLLCGHVHCAWKLKNDMLNVGCDVWNYEPLSEDEVAQIFKHAVLAGQNS